MPNTIHRLRSIVDQGWTSSFSLAVVLGYEAADLGLILSGHVPPSPTLLASMASLTSLYDAQIRAGNALFLRQRIGGAEI